MFNTLISYQQENAEQAFRLAKALGERGKVQCVNDTLDNSNYAEDEIRSCDALVLVVSLSWLENTVPDGKPRIDNPPEPVQRRLALARRYGKPVIIALLSDTQNNLAAKPTFLTKDHIPACPIDETEESIQHLVGQVHLNIMLGARTMDLPSGLPPAPAPTPTRTTSAPTPAPATAPAPPTAREFSPKSGIGNVARSIGKAVGNALDKLRDLSKRPDTPAEAEGPPTDVGGWEGGVRDSSTTSPPEPVLLGASAPQQIKAGEEFTARFVAYLEHQADSLEKELSSLSPRATSHLGLKSCQWQHGAKVSVSLNAQDLVISSPSQQFVWNGEKVILEFDVLTPLNTAEGTIVLKFDVSVDTIVVARLRMDLQILARTSAIQPSPTETAQVVTSAARTAFASYSSNDRQRVLDRVAAVRISAGLDIFLDCMSLHPGEAWKPRLSGEIKNRDLFLLFWSTEAAQSQWVTWEWQTALREKGLNAMQIHPLQVGVRPPEELKDLHFGDVYMMVREGDRAKEQALSTP